MMDQPNSSRGYGGGVSMNKVPQYHFNGSGQSFQHPIYCNSPTTVKGYGGGGGDPTEYDVAHEGDLEMGRPDDVSLAWGY